VPSSISRYRVDKLVQFGLAILSYLTVALLVGILLVLLSNSLEAWREINLFDFLFGTDWNPSAFGEPAWGIASLVVGTLMIAIFSLIIGVPFGLCIATYLSEIAAPRTREFLKPVVEMIASIPSVILGLLGLLYLSPLVANVFQLSNGINAMTASILVAIAALPTIASISEDALSSVPNRLRESSLALGATGWMTITRIVIPAAKRGIVAAIMLGLGRIIGETMIVLMVAGNSRAFPHSLLDPVRPMTANIAIEIKEVVLGSLHWQSLFAIGLVLFLMTFAVNALADLLINKKS